MAERPKLLFVCHNHPTLRPGGAEGYALDLYEAIRDNGEFEALLLARAGPPVSPAPGEDPVAPPRGINGDPNQYLFNVDLSNYDWLRGRPASKDVFIGFFHDFLLEHRPDVIHFQHTLFIGYEAVRVARSTLPDAAIVYTFHEYLPICHRDGQMVRTLNNELCSESSPRRCNECFPEISPQTFFMRKRYIQSHLSAVDLFLTPSEYALDRYVDWGIPADKIQVEPYSCPPVDAEGGDRGERPRNRFGFFGQFTPYKGCDVLLDAVQLLGDDFDGHVWIHGANLDMQVPEFQARFTDLIESAGEKVTLCGPYDRAELPGLMGEIDWVVVPSIWWETGPFVVLEAFQHGRPVICSDIGGMSEKVGDSVSGLHFRSRDPRSLAEMIRRAATTPGLWDQLRVGIPPVPDVTDRAKVMRGIYEALIARRRAVTEPDLVAAD